MGLSALQVTDYKQRYLKYIQKLAQGETNLSAIARELNVDRETLYNWAKRDCFAEDLAIAKAGLQPLNTCRVVNAIHREALSGDVLAAKLYFQHETGWNERSEVKTEIINADAIVGGVLDAIRKAKNASRILNG